jgi:hypothetical protein
MPAPEATLVDHAEPLTFAQLANRFEKLGMTKDNYRRRFHLPLSFEDITSPTFASEIVGYRPLIDWFHHARKSSSRAKA